jgi:hypothetical protein
LRPFAHFNKIHITYQKEKETPNLDKVETSTVLDEEEKHFLKKLNKPTNFSA